MSELATDRPRADMPRPTDLVFDLDGTISDPLLGFHRSMDVDMLAARANGLSSVGVLWGYGSASELQEAGADVLVSDVGELLSLFSVA